MITKNKLNRKQQIIEKATQLFQKQGYAATSMRDLASYIGIEAASLYSHIKSKEEILQTICFQMANDFFESLEKIELEKSSADEKLKKAVISHVIVLTKDSAASAVFFSEWRHLSESYLKDFLSMRNNYENKFIQILIDGYKEGVFKKMDAKFTVLALLSSINWMPSWYKPEGKLSPEEIAENVTDVFINGLKIRS
ncbi:TetR family transcriptional regulator [Marivirga tractuosa]|uniref:Transcriptional regulator, TetR family n=1 Tax=Marivirga tractuosa (strain ATCC 23168 / DSM 4126 / NBRC 15989 / NCIMB 1408 / VKM B-1430 / H-43) TaxID=643867 RepID=E4TLZ0_MARTH|nr:TetR/AcrR family transcriptional regulator [Marivirga tractuosa]ADR20281.1 transcriptional regulator, TetR family [Marivirga tractuosa DSM 4126]BDD15277.1 TetR family transcriptional regulator [Marivirga tractuosa]